MGILKAKLHPALAFATIVVAFVGFVWLGIGVALDLDNSAMAQETGRVMENKMENTWNTTVAVAPAIDAQQTTAFETATFAVG